jgi:Tol biopolymer transport system component
VTIAGADGSRPAEVEALNGDIGPVWSPAGGEIAFQAHRTEVSRPWINLVRPDGTSRRRLAPGRNPKWSPDGRRLAFIDLSNRLVTMTRDGKRKRRVSRDGESVVAAAWSPKGDTLAFVAGTPNPYGGSPRNLRLESARANGTRLRVLMRSSDSSRISGGPIWTPNAKRVLVTLASR